MPLLATATLQNLTARLNRLSDGNKATVQLIQRLAKLDFSPGAVPLDADEGDARLELGAEIHESLKQLDEELELLRQEVEDALQGGGNHSNRRRDSAKEGEKARLAILLARLEEDLKASRTQFRRAQLTAKRNADRAKLKERELLFSGLQSGSSTPTSTHRRRGGNARSTEDEVITSASSDVTAALRRTQQLMQDELSRSRFAQETLEQSTAALADLGEKYTDLNTLLGKSRTLVTTLLNSQKSDTWYLETTLYILISTVIWLVFRRWLYGPISWFILWPLKVLFRIAFAIVPTAGAATSVAASQQLSSSTSTSTSLIVQPSATGGAARRPFDSKRPPAYIAVGGGNKGYQADPSPPGSYSQHVGAMAEQSQNQNQNQNEQGEEHNVHPQLRNKKKKTHLDAEDEGPVVRGDGTVLPDRPSDRPPNPKKKMWDEDVEARKREEEKAAARAAAAAGGGENGKGMEKGKGKGEGHDEL